MRRSLGVPTRGIDLRLLFVLPMGNDTGFDVEGVDQVLPGIEVEVEHCLVFLRACRLLLSGIAFDGY